MGNTPSRITTDISEQIRVTGGGAAGAPTNITGINGFPPALGNPLPVELSDGNNALGTATNPLYVEPKTVRSQVGSACVSNSSGVSGVSLVAAGGVGVFRDIVSLTLTNRSATATIVSLTDGTITYTFAIAANGGVCSNFTRTLPATSSNTAWTIGNSAAVAMDYVVVWVNNT